MTKIYIVYVEVGSAQELISIWSTKEAAEKVANDKSIKANNPPFWSRFVVEAKMDPEGEDS